VADSYRVYIGVRGREALIYHALCRWWDRDAGRGLGVVKERERDEILRG
jgi:hypothetical protein